MESEISLPYLQVPAHCPFPQPPRSSPCPNIPFPKDPSQYDPPTYVSVFQVVSFPQVSQPKLCIRLSSPPYTLHATHLILLDFITRTVLGEECRSFGSSLYSFLQSVVTSYLLVPNIIFNTLFSNILSLRSSLDY